MGIKRIKLLHPMLLALMVVAAAAVIVGRSFGDIRSRQHRLQAMAVGAEPSAGQARRLLAIRNVTVITGTGAPPIENATVLIRDDRIAAVGSAASTVIPADARLIEGAGKFLVPGFIEMHAHLSKARASGLGLFVTNGVTTVRDMGGDHEELWAPSQAAPRSRARRAGSADR